MNLLTTPKYRSMGFMYVVFQLFDNLNLVLIVVLTVVDLEEPVQGTLTASASYIKLSYPSTAEYVLLGALGLELFYDVMLFTHRFWILQRLSIYVGVFLYAAYGVIIYLNYLSGDYKTPREFHIVLGVLVLRSTAFIMEECVDLMVDGVCTMICSS